MPPAPLVRTAESGQRTAARPTAAPGRPCRARSWRPVANRLATLLLLASCAATTTASFLSSQEGYDVTSGYVIRLRDLQNPKVRKLSDGVAYTVTAPGCTVLLELGRGQQQELELSPGDVFVQSRPLSHVLRKR